MTKNYILFTPAKNEENNLPDLIESISSQTLKPKKWLIANDNSTDSTSDILKKATKDYDWIEYINLHDNKYREDPHNRYGYICKKGFKKLIDKCKQENIKFDYIGNVDADLIFPSKYFEELLDYLEKNPNIGWVGGDMRIKEKGNNIHEESGVLERFEKAPPSGSGILFRKEAYSEIGGWPSVKSSDTVVKILLREKDWRIKKINDVKYWQTRPTSSVKGYSSKGELAYYLNTNLFSVLNASFSCLFYDQKPVQKAFQYILGYFKSFINNEEKIDIEIVREKRGSYKLFIKRFIKLLKNNG